MLLGTVLNNLLCILALLHHLLCDDHSCVPLLLVVTSFKCMYSQQYDAFVILMYLCPDYNSFPGCAYRVTCYLRPA